MSGRPEALSAELTGVLSWNEYQVTTYFPSVVFEVVPLDVPVSEVDVPVSAGGGVPESAFGAPESALGAPESTVGDPASGDDEGGEDGALSGAAGAASEGGNAPSLVTPASLLEGIAASPPAFVAGDSGPMRAIEGVLSLVSLGSPMAPVQPATRTNVNEVIATSA